ncbi:serine/threonine protein kinase [Nocardiopsis sp. EMB25]|uniref:serine/threonine-protein kinase n=1 Tax=Nocardiopsis sp. EMB25 TaxID=2835867 RepID=UPI002283A69A|nr:serine/threonine-protein kinase [Nocardiopsis sp. EMB25]MCY9785746.1 serine/threonine protein kinase [Nocardiopsis sp. EMB25]
MSPDSPRPFDQDHLPPGIDPPGATDPRQLGDYRVVGRIGAGGMGAVYAGVDPAGACAAVKVIHPQFAANPEFLARFAREVELVSRVRATCTAAFYGADVRASAPWLATEYVRGLTLRQHVRANGPLTGGMLLSLAVGLAEALAAVHEADIVHRDLKPGNIMLSPEGPKVLDFGIARAADATALTRTGGLMGTPGWMAPEQYLGQEATARSDMFAWGGLVAFAATGRNPFGTGNAEVLIHRTREEEPDLEGVPPELLDLVRRAMDKSPQARPTAARALAELTDGWNATRVQPARDVAPTRIVPDLLATEWRGVTAPEPRPVRRPRRGRRIALVTSVTAALVAVTIVAAWLVPPRSDGAPEAAGEASPSPEADGGEGGPAVLTSPEDFDAVLAEAVRLAREAPSFAAFSSQDSGDVGDGQSVYYEYTEDPEPVYLDLVVVGGMTDGRVEVGEGPDDVLGFIESGREQSTGYDRNFYRDAVAADSAARPRDRWETALDELDETVQDGAEVTYQGVDRARADFLPGSMAGDRDLASREGHHYTGSFMREPVYEGDEPEVTFELWVGDDGYPLTYRTELRWEGPTEAGDPFGTATYDLVFVQFGEPVEIELPDESEIAASRSQAQGFGS